MFESIKATYNIHYRNLNVTSVGLLISLSYQMISLGIWNTVKFDNLRVIFFPPPPSPEVMKNLEGLIASL